MAKFHLTDQGGATYEVEAPDEHSAVAALGQMAGGGKTETPSPPPSPESKGVLQTVREAIHAPTRALENGLFLGLGDRIRAGMGAILGDGSYGNNLKAEQGDTQQFHKDHPIAAPIIEGVGGIAAPLGVLGAAAGGTSLGTKTLLGAGTGALIGGTQGAAGSKDWTNLPQVGRDTLIGGGAGLLLGGALPATARGAGALYETAANALRGKADGLSRGASRQLVDAVTADTPAAVRQRLTQLGPDAMLVDAGPSLLGKGQGASLNSDEGRSALQNTLTARNTGTNQRISSDVERALGPAEDPQTVTNAIIAHRSAVDGVNYPAALTGAPDVKIAPILVQLEDMIPRSVGMEKKALTNLRDMMMKTEKQPRLDAFGRQEIDLRGNPVFDNIKVSQNDAEVLHKVKGELDNVIQYDAPGLGVPAGALSRQQGALKHMRGQVNEALETQVPGYANANAVSAALARRGQAVDLGTQYLGSGKTTASPQRFSNEFTRLEPGEQIAFAKGSRGNVDRVLGTKANDLQALRTELQGEGGWNTAKIATVHGQDAADQLVNTVDRNLAFRGTYNKIVENSQTAQRQAAAKAMKPDPSSETPMFNPNSTLTGMGVTAAKKVAGAAFNALTRTDPTRSFGEVARVLTSQGSQRDRALQAVIDAIEARRENAATAPVAGNMAAVVAAMLANGAARNSLLQKRER